MKYLLLSSDQHDEVRNVVREDFVVLMHCQKNGEVRVCFSDGEEGSYHYRGSLTDLGEAMDWLTGSGSDDA